MKKQSLEHPFAPIYNENTKILILGTFPSVKSRENAFYYGHTQNRFWQVLSEVFQAPLPQTTEEKTAFLLQHHVGVWDVLASCEIKGSADSTIAAPIPNDIIPLLNDAPIEKIYTNGKKAFVLYEKYILPNSGVNAIALPSTSPANASYSLEKLIQAWIQIADFLPSPPPWQRPS